VRTAEIALIYNDYIDEPPVAPAQLFNQACSNDSVTIESWRKTWIDNTRANKEYLGTFKEFSVGQLFQKNKYGVAICAGSGPSLGVNGKELLNKGDIPLISCLHNFHFFEDLGVKVDYYVSLDAGPVVIEEVSEGGKKSEDEYWKLTKDRTLIAFTGSHPDLFKKWQGKIYVFAAPVPDKAYLEAMEEIEPFHVNIGNGGNVLGACLYFAKAILGVHRVGMVGADFCFDNKTHQKFHSWDSKYDQKRGHVIPHHDVFGNKVFTWPSYKNFKNWFEYLALSIPDNNPETKFYSQWMVNCSEGGTLGSYAHGNLRAITQMPLGMFLNELNMSDIGKEQIEKPDHNTRRLLF
jgi:hypothetical protein